MNLLPSSNRVLVLPTMIAAFVGIAFAEVPSGWLVSGSDPKSYEIGLDHNVSYTGRSSAYIKEMASTNGFATLMQSFQADLYRGKRIRLSAYVKSADVKKYAGLWMRVDAKTNTSVAFDNMFDRPIKGTSDWTRYEVVLDVPEEAVGISLGVNLQGPGMVWSDDFEFGVVDTSVPVTGRKIQRQLPKLPVNLDFEER